MFGLSFAELAIIGILAVLLFGKRLPEVAKQVGQTYRQFRDGLAEFQKNVDFGIDDKPTRLTGNRTASPSPRRYRDDDYDEPTAPKFEPPTAEPTDSPATPV